MAHVIAVSPPSESWRQDNSQLFSVRSFHNSGCPPLTSSGYAGLCCTWKVPYCFIFSLIFLPRPCFPYRAFGLSWKLLPPGITRQIKPIQNQWTFSSHQQDFKYVCKVEKLFFGFIFVCWFHFPILIYNKTIIWLVLY